MAKARKQADPQPTTNVEVLLAQVRDELRGLRADLAGPKPSKPKAEPAKVELEEPGVG